MLLTPATAHSQSSPVQSTICNGNFYLIEERNGRQAPDSKMKSQHWTAFLVSLAFASFVLTAPIPEPVSAGESGKAFPRVDKDSAADGDSTRAPSEIRSETEFHSPISHVGIYIGRAELNSVSAPDDMERANRRAPVLPRSDITGENTLAGGELDPHGAYAVARDQEKRTEDSKGGISFTTAIESLPPHDGFQNDERSAENTKPRSSSTENSSSGAYGRRRSVDNKRQPSNDNSLPPQPRSFTRPQDSADTTRRRVEGGAQPREALVDACPTCHNKDAGDISIPVTRASNDVWPPALGDEPDKIKRATRGTTRGWTGYPDDVTSDETEWLRRHQQERDIGQPKVSAVSRDGIGANAAPGNEWKRKQMDYPSNVPDDERQDRRGELRSAGDSGGPWKREDTGTE